MILTLYLHVEPLNGQVCFSRTKPTWSIILKSLLGNWCQWGREEYTSKLMRGIHIKAYHYKRDAPYKRRECYMLLRGEKHDFSVFSVFDCFSFLTLPAPNILCQIQGERKFFKGRQLFLSFGDMSASKKYSPSDTLFYMSSQSWFLVDLVSFLEEIILCYLTLFSQVYFFRYLIKNFKVSICISHPCTWWPLASIYCLQEDNHEHVDT